MFHSLFYVEGIMDIPSYLFYLFLGNLSFLDALLKLFFHILFVVRKPLFMYVLNNTGEVFYCTCKSDSSPHRSRTNHTLLFDLFLNTDLHVLHFFNQYWNNFKQIAYDAIICHIKDICFRIFIDGYNDFGIRHTGQMLNGARNTDRNIKVWCNNLSCLPDLQGIIAVFRVTRTTRSTYCTA